MKKIIFVFSMLLMVVMLASCNQNKKPTVDMLYSQWYNKATLPSIDNPLAEAYDGSYSIQIDKDNKVIFKPNQKETLTGTLEVKVEKYRINYTIKFDNEKNANGTLFTADNLPYMSLFYDHINYQFSTTKAISKEEYDDYRSNFASFLRNSFINNNYPTIEVAENDPLYKEYTNFIHIDPCCNGPKIYSNAYKANIEIDIENNKIIILSDDEKIKTVDLEEAHKIYLVKANGEIELLDEIVTEECLFVESINYEYIIYYFEVETES